MPVRKKLCEAQAGELLRGAEFVNRHVERWAERRGVGRSRGRPRRSNDQARAEERNAHAVRGAVGDARFEGAAAASALDELYAALCDLLNFYMPVRRSAGRTGGRRVATSRRRPRASGCSPRTRWTRRASGGSPPAATCLTPRS